MTDYVARGRAFEAEVETLLRLLGYSVSRNVLLSGTQIDMVAERSDPLNNVRLLVECTERDAPLGVEVVKQKAAALLSIRDPQYFVRLLLVTRLGFTAEARAFAGNNPQILLRTVAELERNLIDFRPYVDWYIANYRDSVGMFREAGLFKNYVELSGRDEKGATIAALEAEVRRLLIDEAQSLVFVLGEFGAGKTSMCRHLCYEMLGEWNDDSSRPLPLLINLREYRDGAANLQQVITDSLINRYGVRLSSFAAFERFCSLGRIVLVLDGFDEMAEKADKQTIAEAFEQIYVLAAMNARLLMTCRSNFFQRHADIIGLLQQFDIELPATSPDAPTLRIPLGRVGRMLTVAKLTPEQIREFVENRVGVDAGKILDQIRLIHDLSDLATRPVLLDMVVSTLPRIDATARVNAASLYQHYTDRWTRRDEWRVKVPLEVRQKFCDSLAVIMHRMSAYDIHANVLEKMMREALRELANDEDAFTSFAADIQTCSFLVRDGDSFRFAHKSFVEYFVARKLLSSLASDTVDGSEDVDLLATLVTDQAKVYVGNRWPNRPLFDDLYHDVRTRVRQSAVSAGMLRSAMARSWREIASASVLERHFDQRLCDVLVSGHDLPTYGELSPEIATFAIEVLLNRQIDLLDFVRNLRRAERVDLFCAVVRRAKTEEFAQKFGDDLRRYALSGDHALLRVVFALTLKHVPTLLDGWFVMECRRTLAPAGWSCLLFELATAGPTYASILATCAKAPDLSLVDLVICTYAAAGVVNVGYTPPDSATLSKAFTTATAVDRRLAFAMLQNSPVAPDVLGKIVKTLLGVANTPQLTADAIAYAQAVDAELTDTVLDQLGLLDVTQALEVFVGVRPGKQSPMMLSAGRDDSVQRQKVRDELWKALST